MRGWVESLVPTSQEYVCDLVSGARPAGECGATKKFWVIGVGQNNQNFLWSFPVVSLFGHYFSLLLCRKCIRRLRDGHREPGIYGAGLRVRPTVQFLRE